VKSTKYGRGRGSSTAFSITRTGRTAYEAHRAALTALLDITPIDNDQAV
jgi:hypothetical protein